MIHTFFLAMVLFPDIQRKAHNEILSVIGASRLPDIKDRPLLPYLDAIVKETLRWHPPVPLGIFNRFIRSILRSLNQQAVHMSYRRMKFLISISLRKEVFVWATSGSSFGFITLEKLLIGQLGALCTTRNTFQILTSLFQKDT
jgi:hypothetical protein